MTDLVGLRSKYLRILAELYATPAETTPTVGLIVKTKKYEPINYIAKKEKLLTSLDRLQSIVIETSPVEGRVIKRV